LEWSALQSSIIPVKVDDQNVSGGERMSQGKKGEALSKRAKDYFDRGLN
jgi:hypothetical protein